MAKEQPAPESAGEEQTSAKLYKSDTQNLKQLASLMNMSMADAYRLVCSPVVDTGLIAAARRRAQEVESAARQRGKAAGS